MTDETSVVTQDVYEAAVKGRQDFRQAYRDLLPVQRAAQAISDHWRKPGGRLDSDDFADLVNALDVAVTGGGPTTPIMREDIRHRLANPPTDTPVAVTANVQGLVERLREALTPTGETKVAYWGEFSWTEWLPDENGIEQGYERTVPWTTVKEIMAAIRDRAGVDMLDEADCLAALTRLPAPVDAVRRALSFLEEEARIQLSPTNDLCIDEDQFEHEIRSAIRALGDAS